MTAIANARLTRKGPLVPAMNTLPMAADEIVYKGTMVAKDANGRAVEPTTGVVIPVIGVAVANYDNRTGSEAGGLDDDLDAEVDYGVYGFEFTGTTPQPGDKVFAVDNQTVDTDDATGTRGVAGVCTEVRDGQCYVWISPLNGVI